MRSFQSYFAVALFLSLLVSSSSAQTISSRVWLHLQDRAAFSGSTASPQSLGISERALHRRAKVLPQEKLVDALDLPIPLQYLDAIRATGATIHATSRWLNAVSIEVTAEQLLHCARLSFVRSAEPVAAYRRSFPERTALPSSSLQKKASATMLDYGLSFTQLSNIKVVDVHNLSINGSGVIIAMLDDGFNNHAVHPSLKNIRVIAEYDFVQQDVNTSRAPGEFASQGNHGAGTLSSIGGFDSGNLIGGAYGASFILAKTEIDSVEIHVEEDNYVAALEWAERLGADVASSSLGYRDFDLSTYSYSYQALNGRTAICSKAAMVAARKGVLLCTAMGNEGFQTGPNTYASGTITAPADADSIVGVGAVSSNGVLASFSSTGPTSDGRIKPEVVAQGVNIHWATGGTSGYYDPSGTSCSTPLVASVAALVFSAHPELTPIQVRDALMQTAQRLNGVTYPNNNYGYGMVNALDAILYHGLVFSNKPQVSISGGTTTVSISIVSKNTLLPDSLFLFYRTNTSSVFQRVRLTATGQQNIYSVSIPSSGTPQQAYFSARDNTGKVRTSPYNAPDSLFVLQQDTTTGIPVTSVPERFILYKNYPNPFNPGTTIRFDAPTADNVQLTIYNSLGQKVRTLFRGMSKQGVNLFTWSDARNDDGAIVASGIYFAVLRTPSETLTSSMILIR